MVDRVLRVPPDWEEQHEKIVAAIKPLLGGVYPGIQGSVLAYLTALWVMGHQTDAEGHEMLLGAHVASVREVLPVAGEEIEKIKRGMQ